MLKLVENVNGIFVALEQAGVKVFDPSIQDAVYLKKVERYQTKRHLCLDIVKEIEIKISKYRKVSPELKGGFHELKCREAGFRYSWEKKTGD